MRPIIRNQEPVAVPVSNATSRNDAAGNRRKTSCLIKVLLPVEAAVRAVEWEREAAEAVSAEIGLEPVREEIVSARIAE
jgi:hypothetical protein